MWWRGNQTGYVYNRDLAGRYTLAEATKIVYYANKHKTSYADAPEDMMVPDLFEEIKK